MNKTIGNLLKTVLLAAVLSTTAHASHDNGLGKSQDGGDDHLASISVAPEPSAFWLFLSGTLMIAALSRYKKKQVTD